MSTTILPDGARARRPVRESRLVGTRNWGAGLALVAVGWVAVVVALLLSGQAPRPAPPGLPDAGPAMAWTVLLSRTLMRLAAVGAAGCLLTAAWLLPPHAGEAVELRRLGKRAALWATGWLLATPVLMLSSSAQLMGVPAREVLGSGTAWAYVPQLAEGRALMLSLPPVLVVALHARWARTRRSFRWLLLAAVLALLPMTLTGHAATSGSHYLATQSLVLHVLAVTVWVGGLLGLVQLRGLAIDVLEQAVRRFSAIALGCFVVVSLSGAASASTRLGADPQAWHSAYGALVTVKIGVLTTLGLAGWWHRAHTIPAIGAGRPRAFRRLAAVELLLMAVATGVAVALARTAPPVRPGFVSAPHPGVTVERGLARIGPVRLVSEWRPDALVVTLVAGLAAVYVASVWRDVRSRRVGARSSVAWFGVGASVLLWAFVGGPAAYQDAMLSGHVGQLLLCLVVVPRLLARCLRGVLVTEPLDRRWTSLSRGLRLTSEPVNAALLVALLLAAVYATPLLELSLRSALIHRWVSLAALLVGCGCVRWGETPAPGPGGPTSSGRAVAVVLALFGAAVLGSRHLFAGDWFSGLPLTWTDPVTDQRCAGLLLVLAAATLTLVERRRSRLRQRTEAGAAESRASMACL